MHQPRPPRFADRGQFGMCGEQPGGECPPPPARTGVHHHTGRLVDHEEMGVDMDDIERNLLGLQRGRRRDVVDLDGDPSHHAVPR